MAELTSGAVTTLLGVIRDEALLLSSVRGDVQFIKQEMESMRSFLAHLGRTGGEHDEPVRVWMNQVRLLAQDCNNCITTYRYYGDPDIHRARDGLRRYVWWLPWFVRKVAAQHDAAIRLRELKDQARDIGERRQRYGVEVPPAAAGSPFPAAAPPLFDDEAYAEQAVSSPARRAVLEARSLDDYLRGKLDDWMQDAAKKDKKKTTMSVAIMVPTARAAKLEKDVLAVASAHFNRILVVDITKVTAARRIFDIFFNSDPLQPFDILYDILHNLQQRQEEGTSAAGRQCQVLEQELEMSSTKSQPQESSQGTPRRKLKKKPHIVALGKREVKVEIMTTMKQHMKVQEKFEEIKSTIEKTMVEQLLEQQLDHMKQYGGGALEIQSFDVLRHALCQLEHKHNQGAAASNKQQDQSKGGSDIFNHTVTMLKRHTERGDKEQQQPTSTITLDKGKYFDILKTVFPKRANDDQAKDDQAIAASATKQQATKATTIGSTSSTGWLGDDDQIREIIDKFKLEIRQELQEHTPHNEQPKGIIRGDDRGQIIIQEAVIEETKNKLEAIKRLVIHQLSIGWMVGKIKDHLKDDEGTLILMKKFHHRRVSGWEETIAALNQVGCIAGVMMMTRARSHSQEEGEYYLLAKSYCYCYPRQQSSQEPIDYSDVGQYYDKVLQLTSQQKVEEEDNYNPRILRDILVKCQPYDEKFWMEIFAHALYSNPTMSNGELRKLHSSLQASPKSSASVAMQMLKFAYNDLPKEYRSCLLYLAIFCPENNVKIRRSTLIGRWVVEGLITKEDWPTSVREANRCFDILIDRYLVYPGDTGLTGKAKSCRVSAQVHQFITKIAKSQHIVETRLSRHLACHFSIFNDLRLRGSDTIDNFFKQLMTSQKSQLSTLKVLDLEGCLIFDKNPRYLKVVCNTLLLLKYLSLRGTDITMLPKEINKLHELEVLDIRQTKLPASATKRVVLLKLKRLLAGDKGATTHSNVGAEDFSSVWIPDKIGKMENMEVLSNVKARENGEDLKDIGSLWQLRKFGVVIEDNKSHLNSLLEAISNLQECLHSLSITLVQTTKSKLRECLQSVSISTLLHTTKHSGESKKLEAPKHLQSLSISGTAQTGQILPLLARGVNPPNDNVKLEQLRKVTLNNTSLMKDDWDILAKLKMLCWLKLRDIGCTDGSLTFKEDEFLNLSYFHVEGIYMQDSKLTKIIFDNGASLKLKKIVLSQTSIESICGMDNLPELREFNGDIVCNEVQEAINTLKNKKRDFVFKPYNAGNHSQTMGEET